MYAYASVPRGPPPPPPPVASRPQWWHDGEAGPQAPREAKKLTTLGLLKKYNHQHFAYYEYRHLLWAKETLTTSWPIVQGSSSGEALKMWLGIFWCFELDRKAQMNFMLFAHQGEVIRCEANEISWNVLPVWAFKPDYQDLSNKTSSMVTLACKHIDRPLQYHRDMW